MPDKRPHHAAEAVEEIRVYRARSVPFTDLRGKTIAEVQFGHAGSMPGKGIYEAVVLTVADGTGYVVWQGHGEVNLSRLEKIKPYSAAGNPAFITEQERQGKIQD